ncbi:energy transducer TonB [Sulfuricurvum sp.]|uniref:energy transducer TonB family protein n=1 Tax=Sulfuricurvum sp. TaxID=2025608 RepID=UPI0019836B3A|nr:energy transducer TonB [Sulfuricurvum sp.]MBD3807065.1 energy transducer TonB [Sulfuricurvum sp.]
MKHSYWFAFSVAVGLHLAIAVALWMINRESLLEDRAIKEERLRITLKEFSYEESLHPITTPSTTMVAKAKKRLAPPKQSPTETLSSIPPALPPTPKRAFTPDDRDQLPFSVLHHYGEEFFSLSAGEQHYIVDNLQYIRKLNEIVGTRLLRERYHDDVDPLDNNLVEFTLHPDGTISDLHLEKNRIETPLDELTLQTITLTHPKYPKPTQETKIRIRVYIIVKE